MELKKLMNSLRSGEGAIVWSPQNRAYFTGFESSDGMLLLTREEAIFLTDSRYTEAAGRIVTECSVDDCGNYYDKANAFFRFYAVDKVFVEEAALPLKTYRTMKERLEPELAPQPLDAVIEPIRRRKNPAEINAMLAAQRIAEAALDHVLGFIRPGLTEKAVALELDHYMLSHGAQALSFETICVSGVNSSMPHGVPSDKKLEPGDFITMDFGAVVAGRHSDMTRTVLLGNETSEKQLEVYRTVLEAQLAGLESVRAGVACVDADAAARGVIEKAGWGECFGHGTGHGVGAEIHEAPYLNRRSKEVLRAGDVVTVEPGIYLPGEFGVRIEDMVFVTEDGGIDLTTAPKQLIRL